MSNANVSVSGLASATRRAADAGPETGRSSAQGTSRSGSCR